MLIIHFSVYLIMSAALQQEEFKNNTEEYLYEHYYPHYDPDEPQEETNLSLSNTTYELDEEYDNDNFFDLFYLSPKKKFPRQRVNDTKTENVTKLANESNLIFRTRPTIKKPFKFVDVLMQYEYNYDSAQSSHFRTESDETSDANASSKQILNPSGLHEVDGNITNLKLTIEDLDDDYHEQANTPLLEKGQTYDNKSLKYLAEFFNLKPAAANWNCNDHLMQMENDKVWYIPEKYPCWELPVLYGVFGADTQASDVFSVFMNRLKNVIDVNTVKKPLPKSYVIIDAVKLVNKWCAVSPCFGDHTLCLFSRKVYSPLCAKDYKVKIPTMTERVALINYLNSMRNSVARGVAEEYSHLPPAADMKQIIYDFDLEEMAVAWLRQCLPGVAPCSSIENEYIMQLDCTKCVEDCCLHTLTNCVPKSECFLMPVVGCIHAWFLSAGEDLTVTDVKCGHPSPKTFNTVQLLWAQTNKIGCAFGSRDNSDVRVVCNFSPGAPYFIETSYFCGLLAHREITSRYALDDVDITDIDFLKSQGIHINKVDQLNLEPLDIKHSNKDEVLRTSDLDSINRIYNSSWVRDKLQDYSNGTKGMIARLVSKYTFLEYDESRCDTGRPIYSIGEPGSLCIQTGVRFGALCYDFGDPSTSFRLVSILASIALFSLILFDLFSGVMRQANTYI